MFADRVDLPEKIYIIGCEYDMLCPEAEDMAEDLAPTREGERVPLGEGRVGWRKGNLAVGANEGVIMASIRSPAEERKAR